MKKVPSFNLPPQNDQIEALNNRFFTWHSDILHPIASDIVTLEISDNGELVAPTSYSIKHGEPMPERLSVCLFGNTIDTAVWSLSLAQSGERYDFEFDGVTRYDLGQQNQLVQFARCDKDTIQALNALLVEAYEHDHTKQVLERQHSVADAIGTALASSEKSEPEDQYEQARERAVRQKGLYLPQASAKRLHHTPDRISGRTLRDILA